MPRPRHLLASPFPSALLLPALLLLAACTTAPVPTTAAPAPAAAAPAAVPYGDALHWARSSAEHEAVYLQTYRLAAERLRLRVEGLQPFTWAVSVDADETLLDNSLFEVEQHRAGTSYDEGAFSAWVRRGQAAALPGARDFLETVRGLGGKVAVVTNRSQAVCPETEANIRALRLPVDVVLCKPLEGPSDKAPRWQAIEQGRASKYLPPLDIVMWLGDNIQDFPTGSQAWRNAPPEQFGRFGDAWFLFPNPIYGSWQRNPQQ